MSSSLRLVTGPEQEPSPSTFRIVLWDQAERDLATLSERQRLQLGGRLERLARAATLQPSLPSDRANPPVFTRLGFDAFDVRLKLDWRSRTVEVTSITPEDED